MKKKQTREKRRFRRSGITLLLAGFVLVQSAVGDELDSVLNLKTPTFLTENARMSVDISARANHSSLSDDFSYLSWLGLDYHKVISTEERDLATVNVQLYLTRFDDMTKHPGWVEGPDDWELVNRITSINWRVLSDQKLNFRVGHFEVPFGLEVPISSNGTLRQISNGPNIGLKGDWGVGFNGTLGNIRYDTALMRGTGIEYHSKNDPYVVAGRIGTATDSELIIGVPGVGISGFYSKRNMGGRMVERKRLGVDAQYYLGPVGLMAEYSIGENEDVDVQYGFLELNVQNADESLLFYSQYRSLRKDLEDWETGSSYAIGLRYAAGSPNWMASVQVSRPIDLIGPGKKGTTLSTQLRYRF